MENDDVVCVYDAGDATTAEMMKNFLEGEGIFCRLGEENQGAMPGVMQVEVLVRAIDADKARKLLEQHEH